MSSLKRLGLVLAVALGLAAPAAAQDYPSRNVTIIVPFGAGGPADVYARAVGQHLSEALKRPFVIENRPGAGAIIGTDAVVKAAPDGHTLLMMSNTHTVNETLVANRPVPADARSRAGGAGQLFRPPDGHQPVRSGQGPEGVPRRRQGKAWRAQLRFVRTGHALSHGRRIVQSHERHRHRARPAPGQRRGPHQRHRRAHADDDRRHLDHGPDRAGRPGQGARRHRQEAIEHTARRPDDRRGRRAGIRGHDLARDHGAERNAAADRRQAERRDQQDPEPAGRQGYLGQAGRRDSRPCRRPSSTNICAPTSTNGPR